MARLFDNPNKKSVINALKVDVPDQAEGNENSLNSVAIRGGGKIEKATQVLSGSGATVVTNLFQITGTVLITNIYGIVEVQLGVNCTAVFLILYDGTVSLELTDGAGPNCSGAKVGSLLIKDAGVATAMSLNDSVAGVIHEITDDYKNVAYPFHLIQKVAVNTYIQMSYTTTDTPTTGQIKWYCEWQAISEDGKVEAV